MKKIMVAVLLTGILFAGVAYAERMHIKEGTTYTYGSSNGRFKIVATAQTDGGGVWSMKLMEGEKPISEGSFFEHPGALAVSDQGNVIAITDPSSHAEFGSESLSIYDANWKRVKQVPFGDPSKPDVIALKIVKVISLSAAGDYCAIGDDGFEGAGVGLYDVKNAKVLWDKTFGFPEIREIAFSPKGGRFLVATSERENFDMRVQLVDIEGKVLLEKRIPKNFSSYDVTYVRFKDDGGSFEVFDTASHTYLAEKIPA